MGEITKAERDRARQVAIGLMGAFVWDDSEEGGDYWHKCCQRLNDIANGKPRKPPLKVSFWHEIILGMFHRSGGKGYTDDEIERAFNAPHQSVSARRRELVQMGKLQASANRRQTRSGRTAIVWVLAR